MRGAEKWYAMALLLLFLLGPATLAAGAEIKWEHDYAAALARAKAEKKPILLDFYNPQ